MREFPWSTIKCDNYILTANVQKLITKHEELMITHLFLFKTSKLSIFSGSNLVTKNLATTKTRSVVVDVATITNTFLLTLWKKLDQFCYQSIWWIYISRRLQLFKIVSNFIFHWFGLFHAVILWSFDKSISKVFTSLLPSYFSCCFYFCSKKGLNFISKM